MARCLHGKGYKKRSSSDFQRTSAKSRVTTSIRLHLTVRGLFKYGGIPTILYRYNGRPRPSLLGICLLMECS